MTRRFSPKPPWLKVRAPGGETYHGLKKTLRQLDLYTVCEEARCPNVGECWREGTATVMLLGDVCTRGCRFCAVTTGNPRGAVDPREPEHVARAIASMGLTYVVMTMVNRDDMLDGGAGHVAATVERLKELRDDILIETLVGDFQGHMSSVDTVVDAAPHVFAHNVEVTRGLSRKIRDVRCGYDQTLDVLKRAKDRAPERLTKSSIMVGIGERDEEVLETMRDLRAAGVDIVTLGQYLRPSPKHAPVDRYVTPEAFGVYRQEGQAMGFAYTASGPLVRSSYKAAEVFVRSVLLGPDADDAEAERMVQERVTRARAAAAEVLRQSAGDGGAPPERRPAVRHAAVPTDAVATGAGLTEAHLAAQLVADRRQPGSAGPGSAGFSGSFVPAERLVRRPSAEA
ncbi:MAG: lipoyl synthase [Myxococcota bacterium]